MQKLIMSIKFTSKGKAQDITVGIMNIMVDIMEEMEDMDMAVGIVEVVVEIVEEVVMEVEVEVNDCYIIIFYKLFFFIFYLCLEKFIVNFIEIRVLWSYFFIKTYW